MPYAPEFHAEPRPEPAAAAAKDVRRAKRMLGGLIGHLQGAECVRSLAPARLLVFFALIWPGWRIESQGRNFSDGWISVSCVLRRVM